MGGKKGKEERGVGRKGKGLKPPSHMSGYRTDMKIKSLQGKTLQSNKNSLQM